MNAQIRRSLLFKGNLLIVGNVFLGKSAESLLRAPPVLLAFSGLQKLDRGREVEGIAATRKFIPLFSFIDFRAVVIC